LDDAIGGQVEAGGEGARLALDQDVDGEAGVAQLSHQDVKVCETGLGLQ
jgi:hypothetical protein